MIEGLKVTISGQELALLCKAQCDRHVDRVKQLEGQLETLKSLDVPNSSTRPGEEAEERIKNHRLQANEMMFIAEHIDQSEKYILGSNDLSRLGISYRGW